MTDPASLLDTGYADRLLCVRCGFTTTWTQLRPWFGEWEQWYAAKTLVVLADNDGWYMHYG